MSIRDTFLGNESYIASSSIITDEEDHVLMAEAMDDLKEIELLSMESDRLNEIAASLESLSQVIVNTEDYRVTDLCYIEVATECALTGTDVTVDEVLPNMEDYENDPGHGATVALERIGDIIKNIWQTILRYIKKLWARVKKFFASIFKAIPRLRKAAEKLKERCDSVGNKSLDNDAVELGRVAGTLSINGEIIKSGEDLRSSLKFYEDITDGMLNGDARTALKIGESFLKRINMLDKITDEKVCELYGEIATLQSFINGDIGDLFDASLTIAGNGPNHHKDFIPGSNDSRYSSYSLKTAVHMLQSRILVWRAVEERSSAALNETDETAAGIRASASIGVDLAMCSVDSSFEVPKEGEINPINSSTCKFIADSILSICDALTKYGKGKTLKDIDKLRSRLEKATDKKAKLAEKTTESEETTNLSRNWRAICNLNKQWGNDWTTFPQAVWQGHVITVSRAAIEACNKSLSRYK